jgi:beta-carotene ketolase (CrtO type)
VKENEFDVIVIGAGVNGLTAGAYLAKTGLKVAVLERRNECGPFALTEDLFGAGSPSDTHAAVCFLPMSPVWGDLELDRFGFDLIVGTSAAAVTWKDGKNIVFYYDNDKRQEQFDRLSQHDGKFALELSRKIMPEMLDILWMLFQPPSDAGREKLFNLGRHIGLSSAELREFNGLDLLDQMFTEEHIKLATLSAADIGLFGDVTEQGEGAVAILLSSLLAVGTPKGGMHSLVHALVRCFRAHGGTLVLNAPVEHVEINPDGSKKVYINDESPFKCHEFKATQAVIFNVSPPVSLKLLGEDTVRSKSPSSYGIMTGWESMNHCAFISHFFVKGLPQWASKEWNPDVQESPFLLRAWDSWAHAKDSLEKSRRNKTFEVLGDVGEIYNQAAQDPTRIVRGMCTVSVEMEYPVSLEEFGGFGKWDDKELINEVHEAHLDMMEDLAPGFKQQVANSLYFTPLDNWRRNASALYGHEIGGDVSGKQWYTGRMPPKCEIPGIYFSQGIWPASLTHLGNGYVSACVVADELGVRKQDWWNHAPLQKFIEAYRSLIENG